MYYLLYRCNNISDVIEGKYTFTICKKKYILHKFWFYIDLKKYFFLERKYQCLGQWEENNQLLAYVQRKDSR